MQVTERLWILCAVTMILSLSSGSLTYAGNLNDGLADVTQKAGEATFAANKDSSMSEESEITGDVSELIGWEPEIEPDATGDPPDAAESYSVVANVSPSGGGSLTRGGRAVAFQREGTIYQEGDTSGCMATCLKMAGVSSSLIIWCGINCYTGDTSLCAACLGVGSFVILFCANLCGVYAN